MAALLETKNLSVGYKNRIVLSGINIAINPSELIVLAGDNGSGKTTLLKTIGGFLPALSGEVLIEGKNIRTLSTRERAVRIAMLFQSHGTVWPFTVQELVGQGRFPYRSLWQSETGSDRAAVNHALEVANLQNFTDRPVTELSGGEMQRVLVARAIAQEAVVMLFDEPVNSLDTKHQNIVMNIIRTSVDSGRCALLSLHDLTLASNYSDRIIHI
ncbi:hypothetical protein FACS1894164_16360 [Spirochaetia bacterium]|nr:hypothetical protein FACS1894164_16360 [Spirochaetia bacterium]